MRIPTSTYKANRQLLRDRISSVKTRGAAQLCLGDEVKLSEVMKNTVKNHRHKKDSICWKCSHSCECCCCWVDHFEERKDWSVDRDELGGVTVTDCRGFDLNITRDLITVSDAKLFLANLFEQPDTPANLKPYFHKMPLEDFVVWVAEYNRLISLAGYSYKISLRFE